jgi:hypothetical protein
VIHLQVTAQQLLGDIEPLARGSFAALSVNRLVGWDRRWVDAGAEGFRGFAP